MTKPTELKLLENLRNFTPKNYQNSKLSIWHKLPVTRRSAVFILLFMGNLGELRVILTKRSSKLRNFPGHVALPGGKADNLIESEWEVSRREMFEEIGLNSNNEELKNLGISIEHLNLLPSYLSRTFSCVKPCIGIMHNLNDNNDDISTNLNLVLNPGESSNIFSCPLKDFLYPTIDLPSLESLERVSYKVKWGGIPWDLRSYTFLQNNPNEAEWLKNIKDLSASDEESELDFKLGHELDSIDKKKITPLNIIPKKSTHTRHKKKNLSIWGRLGSRKDELTNEKIYDVWGLTANILHDLAQLIYIGKIDHNIGEEEMIYSLFEFGNQLKSKERSQEEIKLIHATHDTKNQLGFNDLLPKNEFERLVNLHKL